MNFKNKCGLATLLIALSSTSFANIIVDTQNIDTQKYHADMYECQTLSQQVDHQQTQSLGRDMLGSTAKGALLGAAGGAIIGGSGSKGAKVGAGVGLVGGMLKHGSERRHAEQGYEYEQNNVMRNCMLGRGYNVLN
jgi:hypothetical protein